MCKLNVFWMFTFFFRFYFYLYAQEEGGAVTQTDVIRAYDTNLPKPDGK